jgi:endoplasmic reticulum Man9GlcNAc2 1,2-alpha-mannosidase
MLLMGLHDEAARARDWVASRMDLDRDAHFNTFETTIRVLGGLLAAHHLVSREGHHADAAALYLAKAVDLADRMLPAFDTPHGLPLSMVNLGRRVGVPDTDNYGLVSTAEAATLQLEFRYLSVLTGNEVYWEKAERVMSVIRKAMPPVNLASIFME